MPPFAPDVTILGSMTPIGPNRPRIGIPWRTSQEEVAENLPKIRDYVEAVEQAGGEAVLLSLAHPEALPQEIAGLEGFVLPGVRRTLTPANMALPTAANPHHLTWRGRTRIRQSLGMHSPSRSLCWLSATGANC